MDLADRRLISVDESTTSIQPSMSSANGFRLPRL